MRERSSTGKDRGVRPPAASYPTPSRASEIAEAAHRRHPLARDEQPVVLLPDPEAGGALPELLLGEARPLVRVVATADEDLLAGGVHDHGDAVERTLVLVERAHALGVR